MSHAPLPESYYANDLWEDSPLTSDEREALRDEIRQLVLGIKEEANIGGAEHSAIGDITLTSVRNESTLSITAYLLPDEIETTPVGDENFDQDDKITDARDASYFRDMGHEWEALEYDSSVNLS